MQIVIDKENLIHTVSIALYTVSGGNSEYEDAKNATIELLEQIGYTPSAEPKLGKWVPEKRFYKSECGIDFEYFIEHCSECGARRRIGWKGVSFCPNCGAMMEKEEKNEQ